MAELEVEEAARLFARVAEKLARRGPRLPMATYRLQLERELTFEAARGLLDYLDALGVGDLYASPFFRARDGSRHGYDIVDHNAVNPELGTRDDLKRLGADLQARGMGMLLDFVPNHMGIGAAENVWWMDVLENGPGSLYAEFFDIDWAPLTLELRGKVLLPILGDSYGRVLESGGLQVRYEQGAFTAWFGSVPLPLNPRTYPLVLEPTLPGLVAALGEEHDAVLELQSILTGLLHLPGRAETSRPRAVERRREKEILKRRLAALVDGEPRVAQALAESLRRLNGEKGSPRSFDALDALLEAQAWRVAHWRVAAEEVNYRRFFDINDLAAIHMEHPRVFDQAHRLLFDLVDEGTVTGLRVDHPDGLCDPAGYFEQLQRRRMLQLARRELMADAGGDAAAADAALARLRSELDRLHAEACARDPRSPEARPQYVVAEKILARGETLPERWLVHGTVGYEFAASVAGLLVDPEGEKPLTETYERFTHQRLDFDTLVYRSKKLVLQASMASELNVLASRLDRLSERDRHSRDFTPGLLTGALREVIASFPVYRTYIDARTEAVDRRDREVIELAVRRARRRNPTIDASVYRFIRSVLLQEIPESVAPGDRAPWREFILRFQQLTAPVMARGMEDTAFYVYNRLVSLNEVGGEPEHFASGAAAFHRENARRLRDWPGSLVTLSTHDTKRSEDVRARISVLSELASEWDAAARELRRVAAPMRAHVDGETAPDPNEEYLLYQTLLGTWPPVPPDDAELAAYTDRIVAYMRKATKEAKVNTSWIDASPEYDEAVEAFVRALLARKSPFWEPFLPLAARVSFFGTWNALSQTLLRLTSPGVPDTYQGTEIWDFSLVDPDNRRPVDWKMRKAMLSQLTLRRDEGTALARELVQNAADGRVKLYTVQTALGARKRLPELFGAQGEYVPLEPSGPRAAHLVAFARRMGGAEVVVAVPRLAARLAEGRTEPPLGELWTGTVLPVARPGRYSNLLAGGTVDTSEREEGPVLRADRMLRDFPVALLERTGEPARESVS